MEIKKKRKKRQKKSKRIRLADVKVRKTRHEIIKESLPEDFQGLTGIKNLIANLDSHNIEEYLQTLLDEKKGFELKIIQTLSNELLTVMMN